MNKRDFLKRLGTLAGVPIFAGAVGISAVEELSGVKWGEDSAPSGAIHAWDYFQVSGFKPCQDECKLACRILARRGDGQYCTVIWFASPENFTPEEVNASLANAFLTLETFRCCSCTTEKQCAMHAKMFPPACEYLDTDYEQA